MDKDNFVENLAQHEKGITVKPTAFDLIMRSPEWKDAKNGCVENPDSAQIIVDHFWTVEHSKQIEERISKCYVKFVTVPSTTGENHIPKELARRIISDIGYGGYVEGESIAISRNIVPMKDVHRDERPYTVRDYLVLPQAQSIIQGHKIVIVEDVLASGASAKNFMDALCRSGFEIVTVAGLIGDSRLTAEPQLVSKLQKTLKNSHIEQVKARDICTILSRGQVEIVIDQLNKTRSQNERENIAGKLSRLLDSRASRLVEHDSRREALRSEHSDGENRSNEIDATGVQNQFSSKDAALGHSQGNSEVAASLNRIQREHQHLLETAPSYSEQLKTLVQAKEGQAMQLESRLEAAVVRQRETVATTRDVKPGGIASMWKGAAWEKTMRQQQARLNTLETRLSRVRSIRTGMAGKRLQEFARKKLQRADPELVARHDAEERERRQRQAEETLRLARENKQTQTQSRGRGLKRER